MRLVRIRGSRRQHHRPTKPGTVTIAGHESRDLAPGTWNNILKQAGFKREQGG
ncbi:MAG: type II toxin-antitoxin system HicA family toxin [Dehalococcoidia bacterium]